MSRPADSALQVLHAGPSAHGRTPVSKIWGTVGEVLKAVRAPQVCADSEDDVRDCAQRFHEVSKKVCELHGLHIQLRGALPTEPAIVVANHRSFADPVVISALMPVATVAKKELESWPLLGRACHRLGVLYVQREDPMSGASVLRMARKRLRSGVSVLTFPEGTTTDGTRLEPFKRGIFGLARHLRLPIIPMHIDLPKALNWVGDDYFLPHYLRFARRPKTVARVTVGKTIHPWLSHGPEILAMRARASIQCLGDEGV